MIPAWIVDAIDDWQKNARTGSLTLHFGAGVVRKLESNEFYQPPPEPAATRYRCPSCYQPMVEHDRGQMFVCACGTKRTLSQMKSLTGMKVMP